MRLKLYLVLIAIFLNFSCAHTPVQTVSIEECVSDPASGLLECPARTIKYSDSQGFVCHTPDQDAVFWKACMLQRSKK
jgi:hypothetical protein